MIINYVSATLLFTYLLHCDVNVAQYKYQVQLCGPFFLAKHAL